VNLIFHVLKRALMTPKLVRKYGRGGSNLLEYYFVTLFLRRKITPRSIYDAAFANVVIEKDTALRLYNISLTTTRAKARRAPLRHCLLHGEPGTGKSVIAEAIAMASGGLPYAIMSGSDLAPLGRHGPEELMKILSWAKSSRNGAILIIDEAEAALGKRLRDSSSTEDSDEDMGASGFARDSLNVLLSLTGTESSDLMLILTTTCADMLDEAVLDRMDEMVELKLPAREERKQLLKKAFVKNFPVSLKKKKATGTIAIDASFNIYEAIDKLSSDANTARCSGRELEKMMQGVRSGCYASSGATCVLNERIWNRISSRSCIELKSKWKLKHGNNKTSPRNKVRRKSNEGGAISVAV
jgi:ATPase family AAA domain-containing protein 3A/B